MWWNVPVITPVQVLSFFAGMLVTAAILAAIAIRKT